MPNHQDRREPLPKEYQFGDAKPTPTEFEYWMLTEQRRTDMLTLRQQVTATEFK